MEFKGTYTALVTPFRENQLDEAGLIQLIRRQIEAGITGLLILGATGEPATLTEVEQRRVIEITVKEAKGKAVIMVGTGSASTARAIEKTKRAQDLGADCALIVTPYYNKPTQEGIFRHFEAITEHVNIPIMIYNAPGRTGVNIETSTFLRLAALPYIAGVKECSGNLAHTADIVQVVAGQYPAFAVMSGDDGLALPMMALGATGLISVTSNLFPKQMITLVNSGLHFQFQECRKMHEQLLPFFRLAFIETNPIPIKAAMQLCNLPAGECRLPLYKMKPGNSQQLAMLLEKMPHD